jgi:hypothetical protein
MKTILTIPLLTLFLLAAATPCLAMMSIEQVTKQRAKELGIDIRPTAAGPDAVRVTIEFDAKADLKDFTRADLEIHDGGKLLASSTIREEQPTPGRVVLTFAADRTKLQNFTVRLVAHHGGRSMTGFDLRIKDFVDVQKLN